MDKVTDRYVYCFVDAVSSWIVVWYICECFPGADLLEDDFHKQIYLSRLCVFRYSIETWITSIDLFGTKGKFESV
jgi:hypothetical protein